MILSVIIPAYNEEKTIFGILSRVAFAPITDGVRKELVVVNDGSRDHTASEVERFMNEFPDAGIRYREHPANRGKGAALRTGFEAATGEFIVIQDADLEYDPREYSQLLQPVIEGFADVVYGSRFTGSNPHRVLFFFHSVGNRFLTFLSNLFTNINLTDMETGYKLFRTEVIRSIRLKEDRFGFEPEVTAKISRIPGVRIYEIGISYYGRTYREGKKINWKDGFRALWCILKYNLFSR